MIRKADIEGSKSNVAVNAWLPQASYPAGNFSGTSSLKLQGIQEKKDTHTQGVHAWVLRKGSLSQHFCDCTRTESHKFKRAFRFIVNMRFPFSLSSPWDTCVIVLQMCRPSQTPHLTSS